MKVKSESEITQSCLTLRDPMDYSLPGSSAHGIFQARVLEWGGILFILDLEGYQVITEKAAKVVGAINTSFQSINEINTSLMGLNFL